MLLRQGPNDHQNNQVQPELDAAILSRNQVSGTVSSIIPWLEKVAPGKSSHKKSFDNSEDLFAYVSLLLDESGKDDISVVREGLVSGPATHTSTGFAALIHDTRNMVAAIGLYCDLLDEPGVLTPSYKHYAGELRLVSDASRRLLEMLANSGRHFPESKSNPQSISVTTGSGDVAHSKSTRGALISADVVSSIDETPLEPTTLGRARRMRVLDAGDPIQNLAEELRANGNLLAAVVGPTVKLDLSIECAGLPITMSREDLTRVLVNLTKNAGEAMPEGGKLTISLVESEDTLTLSFLDSASGIPEEALEAIFTAGYSSSRGHAINKEERDQDDFEIVALENSTDTWPVQRRGLGLAIVRSLVTAAGGLVWATNRTDGRGAAIVLEFPKQRKGEQFHQSKTAQSRN